MNSIQNWFDQVVGFARYEQRQRKRAYEIFGATRFDVSALEMPACWRRTARVGRLSGRLQRALQK